MATASSRIPTEKEILHAQLSRHRDVMLWKLEGLSDAAIRRPMTRSGTNLLGLVKHLVGVERSRFADPFGLPVAEPQPWFEG